MRNILLALLILPTIGFSQRIETTISEGKFGTIDAEFFKTIENGDTSYFLACSFQNAEYTTITDIGSIFITDQLTLDSLISDLEGIAAYFGTKTKISYDRKKYSLTHYDFDPSVIYVREEDDKHTMINKKNAEKWLIWLKTIKFPKSE